VNQNELFFAKARQQNRSLAELNEDFGGVAFAEKNHFDLKRLV